MPPSSKIKRVSEEEVMRRWETLDLEMRQTTMLFRDPILISRIRSALQTLFQQHTLMLQMGIKLAGEVGLSPFDSTALFMEAFELPWTVGKSDEMPHLMIMDIDDQPSYMTLKSHMLEGSYLFNRLRRVLPDFLKPQQATRVPLPRARWKDLFAAEPSSIASMEQQLTKLVEQALWAMGSDAAFDIPNDTSKQLETQTTANFEDWVDKTLRTELKEKGKKSKKKKKKKPHPTTLGMGSSNADEIGGELLVDEVSQLEEPVVEETLQTVEGSVEGFGERCSPNTDSTENPTGEVVGEQLVDEVSQLEDRVVEKALQTIEEDKGLDNSILAHDVGASEFVQGFFANAVATQGRPHQASENVLAQHYWGAGRRHFNINKWLNLDVRRRQRRARVAECPVDVETKCSVAVEAECPTVAAEQRVSSAVVDAKCPTVEFLSVSDSEDIEVQCDTEIQCDSEICLRPPIPHLVHEEKLHCSWKPPQLVRYIWNQTSLMMADTPDEGDTTSTLSPSETPPASNPVTSSFSSTPWSRGFWSTPHEGIPLAGAKVVVRKTFIDVDEKGILESMPPARSSRSLSP